VSGIIKPILLPAAIVDEMELLELWSFISSTLAAGSSIGLTIPDCAYSFVLLMMGGGTA
jgi:hypothetical protein